MKRDETDFERSRRRTAMFYWGTLLFIIAMGGFGAALLVFR